MTLIAAIAAALAVHEAGHWMFARALGYPARILLTLKGPATMWGTDQRISPPRHRVVVAAAGPAANTIVALTAYAAGANALAAISLLVGLSQLIPLGPTDGKHILSALKPASARA